MAKHWQPGWNSTSDSSAMAARRWRGNGRWPANDGGATAHHPSQIADGARKWFERFTIYKTTRTRSTWIQSTCHTSRAATKHRITSSGGTHVGRRNKHIRDWARARAAFISHQPSTKLGKRAGKLRLLGFWPVQDSRIYLATDWYFIEWQRAKLYLQLANSSAPLLVILGCRLPTWSGLVNML